MDVDVEEMQIETLGWRHRWRKGAGRLGGREYLCAKSSHIRLRLI